MVDAEDRTRETERRRATVLFADITGFTSLNERLDPEDAYAIVTGCLKQLDAIARRHGGSVEKYLGDALMVVFGVPLAMEEGARAAVNAAIEMRQQVHAFNGEHALDPPLDLHSGINTGLLISGDVSGPMLREFAVMGDAVNVAARLKDKAPPGTIWVGSETHRQTQDVFEYRALPAMRFKGKSEPLPIYEVVSERAQVHRLRPSADARRTTPLIGRDAVLARLAERVAALAGGRGGILSLVAEAGVGKSRLVVELAGTPEAGSVTWLEGRSVSVGANLGFHPFQDLLRTWAGLAEGEEDADATAKLDAAASELLGEQAAEVTPFVASLLGLPLRAEHRKRLHGVSGEALEKLQLGAVSRILRGLGRRGPTLLVFEDLHWADRSSIELLVDLLPLTARLPILVLNVCRPGYEETTGRFFEAVRASHAERHEEVRLEPLDPVSSERLIDALFESADVPAATRDLLERKTAGNPFFIQEVVRSLVEEGALVERDGRLRATERIHDVIIPGTVQEVIMARIDRLAEKPRLALQVASVIGRNIERAVLADVAEDERLDASLATLGALDLLGERRRGERREYVFAHPLIRDVCYEGILRVRRRELHLRTARAIEALLPDTSPGFHGMLAFHFGAGKDQAAAEEYLLKAGEEAARVAASSEALHFFQEAFRVYREVHGEGGDPGKRALLQKNIALAHFNRGQLIEAVEHLSLALEGLGARMPQRTPALALRTAGTLARTLPGLYVQALQRARPPATDHQREVVELMFKRSQAETTTEPLRFLAEGIEVIRELSKVDPRSVPAAGGLYAGVSGMFAYAGAFGLSARFLARAEKLVDESDVAEALVFRLFRFIHHMLSGDWSDAYDVPDALLEENLRRGVLWHVSTYLGLLAKKRAYQGRFDEAGVAIERLVKIDDLYAYGLARESHQGCAAFLALERGDLEAARAACDVYLEASDELLPNLLGLGTRARAEALLGRLDEARASLARAAARAREVATRPPFHESCLRRSELLVEVCALEVAQQAGDRRGAARARRAAMRSAKRALASVRSLAWRRPEVHRLAGRLAWLRGRRRTALAHWGRALDEATRLGMRPELARIHMELGQRLSEKGMPRQTVRGLDAAAHTERGRTLTSSQ